MKTLKLFLWMTLLTGVIYPLTITLIAQLTMKQTSDGGFLSESGRVVGATLIGQGFVADQYFWPRPSATDYSPLPSGGSNLSVTSTALKQVVEMRKQRLLSSDPTIDLQTIPNELLYASGSGIDPHISPQGALFQINRVVKARGWDEQKGRERLIQLIIANTEQNSLFFLKQPCVNVLKLNMALQQP